MSLTRSRASAVSWNTQVVGEIMASKSTHAVILTDSNGRVLHCEHRQDMPEQLGELLDVTRSMYSKIGQKFGLGELKVSTASYGHGTLVWALGVDCAVAVVGSNEANLGQLMSQVRRLFSEGGET